MILETFVFCPGRSKSIVDFLVAASDTFIVFSEFCSKRRQLLVEGCCCLIIVDWNSLAHLKGFGNTPLDMISTILGLLFSFQLFIICSFDSGQSLVLLSHC